MKNKTKIIKSNKINLKNVANLIVKGQVIAIPTETVYGLAGRADRDKVIQNIYKIKERPSTNPLIIHYKNVDAALKAIFVDKRARALASNFWPGPLTIVANRKSTQLSPFATSNLESVAVRVPSHPILKMLLNLLDFPLAAPSANIYGKISPTSAADVKEELGGKISTILDGGKSKIGLESTVVDLTNKATKILRYGYISNTEIKKVLGEITLENKSNQIKSPGQVLSHYKPNKKVVINAKEPIANEAWLGFGAIPKRVKGPALSLSENKCLEEAAKNLYSMMRILDKKKSNLIVVQKIPKRGIGIAINDRLYRASSK